MNHITRLIFSILAATLCLACSDSESFTTDAGARLEFSTDVVQFDTVFCGIGSSTRRLIVHNRNSQGVRLSSVALQSGGQAGFRMNVDGLFGATVGDVEILADDSIFIFLETTVAEQAEAVRHATDRILFNLESGVRQSVELDAYGMKAISLKAKRIDTDTDLTPDLPYIIYDSLVVAPGACLTLKAGTRLHFHQDASLVVHGALKIEGEAASEVVLRCDRLDKLLRDLPYDLTDAQWGGVVLTGSCTGCDIRYADIHGGKFGIDCDAMTGTLNIHNSTIHNVAGDALRINRTEALVANTQITNALGHCVNIQHAKADFYHCTIAQFYRWNSDCGHAVMMEDMQKTEESDTEQPVGAGFYNCLITGRADDEVFAAQTDGAPAEMSIRFHSCVVNTDTSDARYFTDCTAESADNATHKQTNFKPDPQKYASDFHLDPSSIAVGKGNAAFTALFPTDRDGRAHSADKPNAGCYSTE